jgi:hypothetical protein
LAQFCTFFPTKHSLKHWQLRIPAKSFTSCKTTTYKLAAVQAQILKGTWKKVETCKKELLANKSAARISKGISEVEAHLFVYFSFIQKLPVGPVQPEARSKPLPSSKCYFAPRRYSVQD